MPYQLRQNRTIVFKSYDNLKIFVNFRGILTDYENINNKLCRQANWRRLRWENVEFGKSEHASFKLSKFAILKINLVNSLSLQPDDKLYFNFHANFPSTYKILPEERTDEALMNLHFISDWFECGRRYPILAARNYVQEWCTLNVVRRQATCR